MVELNSARSTILYCQNHSVERRNWLQCLPLNRVRRKVAVRLRPGYTAVGFFASVDNAVLSCPRCRGYDSVRHVLLDCNVNHEQLPREGGWTYKVSAYRSITV